MSGSNDRIWLLRPDESFAGAPVRLFCFGHAGAGPSFFRPWLQQLCGSLEVWRALLPGRESRYRESPCTRIDQAARPLCEAIVENSDKPFVLFGHSLGAAVAFEVARRLTNIGLSPGHLIVSGRRAPHLPAERPPFYKLPDDELLEVLGQLNGTPGNVLQNKAMSAFIPSIRADFEMNETFQSPAGLALDCPVSAFAGLADSEVKEPQLRAWEQITRGRFTWRFFEGDHFYLKSREQELLPVIEEQVQASCATASAVRRLYA